MYVGTGKLTRGFKRAGVSTATALVGLLMLLVPCRAEALITLCSVSSVVGVSFGGYDVFSGTSLDSTGSITYSCANVGVFDTITISLSRGGSATFVPRRMASGANTLSYNLYRDAARSVVWGDGTGGSSVYGPVNPPAIGSSTVSVFGRIPALQNVPVGVYGDAIVATINF